MTFDDIKDLLPKDSEDLSFFYGEYRKKDSFDKGVIAEMAFDSSLVRDLNGEALWARLDEMAIEWLKRDKKLPSFAKSQDYERKSFAVQSSIGYYNSFKDYIENGQPNAKKPIEIDDEAFNKIVLPLGFKEKLIEVITQLKEHDLIFRDWGLSRVISKGKGVNILLTGPSGTGKTFCGEIIAEYLGLEVEFASAATIESKWVGESEKATKNLFQSLGANNKVLILDEADTFLTSRDGLQQDHAKKLTNQFLIELERHNGVCILTTNRPISLDKALARRIDLVLDFPMPTEKAREEIWKAHLVEEIPKEKLDFKKISQIVLSGGQIKNAVLTAARRLALEKGKNTMFYKNKLTTEKLLEAANSQMLESITLEAAQNYA